MEKSACAIVLGSDTGGESATACPAWLRIQGLVHGTTTRQVLPGEGKEDLFVAVARAREAGAIPPGLAFGAEQVHGAHIEVIDQPIRPDRFPARVRCDAALGVCEFPQTDALVTTIPGTLLIIQTADCLPVFLVDAERRVAALAHCGWRGLRQGLAGLSVEAMRAHGADPAAMRAWLGPCIRVQNYEVSAELVEDFRDAFPGAEVSPDGRRLDLAAVARWQLTRAGLNEAAIADSAECTFYRPARYHSYRREGERAGRLLSFIGFTGVADEG